jgi:hypothetical protein
MKIISILLLILWGIINSYLIYSKTAFSLGGSIIIFYVILFMCSLLYRFGKFYKFILQSIILCAGIIILNVLGYYFDYLHLRLHFSIGAMLAGSLFVFILVPLQYLVDLICKSPEDIADEEEKKFINKSIKAGMLIIVETLGFSTLVIIGFSNNLEMVSMSRAIYTYFGGFIVAILVNIFIWQTIKVNQVRYFIRDDIKLPIEYKKAQKYFLLITVFIASLSFLFEIERGMWLLCGQSVVLLILIMMFLWQFYRHVFIRDLIAERPNNFKMANLLSIKGAMILISILTLLSICLIIFSEILRDYSH